MTTAELLMLNAAVDQLRRHVLKYGHCENAGDCDCADAQARRFLAEFHDDLTWLRTPFEVSRTDRLTINPALVTCAPSLQDCAATKRSER